MGSSHESIIYVQASECVSQKKVVTSYPEEVPQLLVILLLLIIWDAGVNGEIPVSP
jgi:hypothetical protein